ncbi:photosystem II protein Y, partial [Salmonella sp. s57402]
MPLIPAIAWVLFNIL